MLTLLGSPRRCCDGLTRRETLQAGALGLLGRLFGAPASLAAEHRSRPGRARSVIVLYLLGGAGTQDMFDLKPDAPADVRGEFRPAATTVPGIQVSDQLPGLAQWMHRAAILRSVNHKGGCHNPLPSCTGFGEPLPDEGTSTRDSYPPSMGSVCEYLRQNGQRPFHGDDQDAPAYVYLPCYLGWGQAIRRPGPYAGFLGKRYDPLFTECAPHGDGKTASAQYQPIAVHGEPRIPNSVLARGVTVDRLDTRRSLARQLDDQLAGADANQAPAEYDRFEQRALGLLTSSQVRAAFDVDRLDPKERDRYGRTLFGQSALIARELVATGVRFVNVTWDIFWDRPARLDGSGWDTHERHFPLMRSLLLPSFDLTYTALLRDLDDRGLLDETLVVVMSEMGRTPKVNAKGGRDHWTYCYSVLLAGAGIRGGSVYGASDAQAAYVKDRPVSPADVCATIYECLGIDPELPVHDHAGRPVPIAHGGRPIREILA